MPRRLLRPNVESFYHCVSRVNGRERSLREAEKAHFFGWMRRLEAFCGVQVVTYCLMENHFHLLVRVPCRERMLEEHPLTVARLRELLPLIYQGRELLGARQELDRAVEYAASGNVGIGGGDAEADEGHPFAVDGEIDAEVDSGGGVAGRGKWLADILGRYEARRYSLSVFLKELKQRYTRWHNRRHGRVGTLWEHRFRSVLVEGDETALLTVAAYIDLNPVRAGLVLDPKDYRWCGYAEAVAGGGSVRGVPRSLVGRNVAREGLGVILKRTSFGRNRRVDWRATAGRYRVLLFGHGEGCDADGRTGAPGRRGMSRKEVAAVLDAGGKLSVGEILRCKVRYMTDGVAIGRGEFLGELFEENRERFGKKRSAAGRSMRGSDWGGLEVLRGLQRAVFG